MPTSFLISFTYNFMLKTEIQQNATAIIQNTGSEGKNSYPYIYVHC